MSSSGLSRTVCAALFSAGSMAAQRIGWAGRSRLHEVEHDARQTAFQGSDGFHRSVTVGASTLVVSAARAARDADLGDRDPMQGRVELPVAATGKTVPVRAT
jgi:hypothetical protein